MAQKHHKIECGRGQESQQYEGWVVKQPEPCTSGKWILMITHTGDSSLRNSGADQSPGISPFFSQQAPSRRHLSRAGARSPPQALNQHRAATHFPSLAPRSGRTALSRLVPWRSAPLAPPCRSSPFGRRFFSIHHHHYTPRDAFICVCLAINVAGTL
jgi:hypothetical protein